MRRIYILSAALLCVALFMSVNVISEAKADNFWTKAAESGMAEVALGNIALERSQNEAVRSFARQMVDDHTAANNELMSLAQGKSITLPTATDNGHQAAMTKLNGLSGDDFDRQFVAQMVKDHKAAVALFEKTSASTKDPDAQAFAAKCLPTLRSHLQMAMSLAGNMGNSTTNTSGRRNANDKSTSGEGNMNMNNKNMNNMNMNNDMNMNNMNSGNSNGMMNSNSNMRMDNRNMNSNMNNLNSNSNSQPGNRNTNFNSRSRGTNSNMNSNSNGGNSNSNDNR